MSAPPFEEKGDRFRSSPGLSFASGVLSSRAEVTLVGPATQRRPGRRVDSREPKCRSRPLSPRKNDGPGRLSAAGNYICAVGLHVTLDGIPWGGTLSRTFPFSPSRELSRPHVPWRWSFRSGTHAGMD
jgi:hypothetical protein